MQLFEPVNFFNSYDQYLELIIVGNQEDNYLMWKGYIEAKIRLFCESLEKLMNNIDFDM